MLLSIGKYRGPSYGLSWRFLHAILETIRMIIRGEVKLAEPEEARGENFAPVRSTVDDRWKGTDLLSGASAFETTVVETSCNPNIFRINKRQLVSRRICPR